MEGEGPFIVTPALQSHGGPRAEQHSMGNGSAFKRFLMVGKDFGQTEVNALAFPAPLAARWEQTVSCVSEPSTIWFIRQMLAVGRATLGGRPSWESQAGRSLSRCREQMPWVCLPTPSRPLLVPTDLSSDPPLLAHILVTQPRHSEPLQGSPVPNPGFQGPVASDSTGLSNGHPSTSLRSWGASEPRNSLHSRLSSRPGVSSCLGVSVASSLPVCFSIQVHNRSPWGLSENADAWVPLPEVLT